MTDKKNRRPILNEPPVLEMKDLEETCQEVSLRIIRSTPAGQWSTIAPQVLKPLVDLKSGELEKWLDSFAGGGNYVVEARDPSTMETILPRWRIVLPGAPKDPKRNVPQMGAVTSSIPGMVPGVGGIPVPPFALASGLPTPQMTGPGQVTLPPQDQMPGWARSYPAGEQWQVYYDQTLRAGQLPQGASMHSDALAFSQAQTWQTQASSERAENAKLRAELESLRKEMRDVLDQKSEEIRKLEQARERERSDAQLLALRTEISALRDSGGRGPNFAEMLTAAAPAFAAWVGASKDRDKIESDRTLKTMELSASQNAAMIQAMLKGKDSGLDWNKILPVALPFVIELFKNTGPAAMAEAQATADETKMMQFKMIADLIMAQAQQGPETPWWLPMIQSVVDGLGEMAQSAALRGPAPPRQLAPGQQQPRPQPQQQQAAPVTTVATGDDAEVWQKLAERDAEAAQLTQLVWKNVPVDAGFHTHEWRLLIFNIHSQVLPQKLAPAIVDHLEHLYGFQMLPPILMDVFEHPQKIAELIMSLPVAQRSPDYAQLLIQSIVDEMAERAAEAAEDGDEDAPDEEDDEGVQDPDDSLVTPPPEPGDNGEAGSVVHIDDPQFSQEVPPAQQQGEQP